ncbi:uncharacterized protein BX663DRAFT_505288, partial [Cokeromyces recurvatus]|uniref:uncharacterized protein n=1 Tax=Cokeromyces recurvatus TaxID=90255 RepID=UPI00221E66D6
MRIRFHEQSLIVLWVAILLVQEIRAELFCDLFDICPSTTTTVSIALSTSAHIPSSATSAAQLPSPSQTVSSQSSLTSISATSSLIISSTNTKISTIASSSRSNQTPTSIITTTATTPAASTKSSSTATEGSSLSGTITTTASPTQSLSKEPKEDNNIGVIVGSVCGFLAIIGAGFAYAFFSKTRRNNRKKRVYSSDIGDYGEHDPFNNTRLSPMAVTDDAWMDSTYNNNNNNNNSNNNSTMIPPSPQPPMAAIPKQHDMYYNNTTYIDPYYNGQQHAYYEPNAITMGYQPQFQQYDPYLIQHPPMTTMHSSIMPATTNSTVYSAPHTYDVEEGKKKTTSSHTTNNNITTAM